MAVMNILRMLVDVSFYGAFAGLIARACGGSGAFLGMLLQCLCFGLSALGRSRRGLRLALLLPMCAGWALCRGSIADCVLLLPTAAYIVRLVWKGDYALDQDRQQRLFGAFWKLLAVVLPLGMLMGGTKALSAATVPYALIMLTASVLLLRALRHDESVYRSKKYQLLNAAAVAAVAAAAGVLSSKAFLRACAAAWKAVFTHVLQPILELLLNIFLGVLWGISWLVSWISPGGTERENQNDFQLDMTGAQEIFGEDIQMKEPAQWLKVLGIILLIGAAVTLLVLFFRWMNRRTEGGTRLDTAVQSREMLADDSRPAKRQESSPVRKIRAQYRAFLKWCGPLGVRLEKDTTTLDVHRQVEVLFDQGEQSGRIRALYIRARYGQKADGEDVRAMKELCSQLKRTKTK